MNTVSGPLENDATDIPSLTFLSIFVFSLGLWQHFMHVKYAEFMLYWAETNDLILPLPLLLLLMCFSMLWKLMQSCYASWTEFYNQK